MQALRCRMPDSITGIVYRNRRPLSEDTRDGAMADKAVSENETCRSI